MGAPASSSDDEHALVRSSSSSVREARANGGYSIYSSTSSVAPGQDVRILAGGNSTDTFVGLLPNKAILLEGEPKPSARFDSSDGTANWLTYLDSKASIELTLDATAQKNIQSFSIKLVQPWSLVFSSASAALLFTFGGLSHLPGGTGAKIPVPGIDGEGKILTLGLDPSTPAFDASVLDLFNYAGLDMKDYLPSALASVLVTLDPQQGSRHRNAMWYNPSTSFQTTIRLQFQLSSVLTLHDLIGSALQGLSVDSADVICRKTMVLGSTRNGPAGFDQGDVLFSVQCSIPSATDPGSQAVINAGVQFSASDISLTFLFNSPNAFVDVLAWLGSLIHVNIKGFIDGILSSKSEIGRVLLRRLSITLDGEEDTKKKQLSNFSIDLEVQTEFGRSADGTSGQPVFLVSYRWARVGGALGELYGRLWTGSSKSATDPDLSPFEEIWTFLSPTTDNPAQSIDLATLIPNETIQNIPDTVPRQIKRAYVSLSQSNVALGATITADPISASSIPQPSLGEISLDASYSWGAQRSGFTLDLRISAALYPSTSSKNPTPAVLEGVLKYGSQDKTWVLRASLHGLYASSLAEFFDEKSVEHVMPLIDSISIDTLDVAYTYSSMRKSDNSTVSVGSHFTINGLLLIASLELDLSFEYTSGSGWTFHADLKPQAQSDSIGKVVESLLGEAGLELPDFLSQMVFDANGKDKNALTIDVIKKSAQGATPESFQFSAVINIGRLSVTFAQLHSKDWEATAPSKRLFKIALQGLPPVDIPLVGNLTQPFDELYYLWVSDPRMTGKSIGLTRQDISQLNLTLTDKLVVKDKFETKAAPDVLLGTGSHFAVIMKDKAGTRTCLLNYDFMKPTNSPAAKSEALVSSSFAVQAAGESTTDSGPSAQAPFKKTAGPLSISNIGLKYKNNTLSIMFDATFELGPLAFSLIGFSIGVGLTTLDNFPSTVKASIEGLSAAFERPPLTIAGIIRHGNTGNVDYYAGGLIFGFVPYQFEAAGFYGTALNKGKEYKSVFIFAKLDGPLITLEFAEISGVTGGFGYNSNVRTPKPEEITEFPFVATKKIGDSKSALEALQKLTSPSAGGWFSPLEGTYWAAAGLKVDAFQMLAIDAVIVVQFGTSVKLSLIAVATGDIPTATSPLKFAHVELGIAAIVDFDYGILKIEAQLSPNSYILHPSCHLTGGAGLYYWFDAPHADHANIGNFVLTFGGYHQAFRVPPGYPRPPRLGISWRLGSHLSVTGEAYFAITPKACMGGGRLRAVFSAGPIEAWFDAFADFLINYKPFQFQADAGISVGVRFNIDFLFIHTHISVEIGARVYLWGPPLAGRVHVDFWIVAFDIDFGAGPSKDQRVTLYQFYKLVLQMSQQQQKAAAALTATDVAAQGSDPQPPLNEGHVFVAQTGLLNPNDTPDRPKNQVWVVRGGTFSFLVACKMAINQVKTSKDPGAQPIFHYGEVYGKPMKLETPMTSTLVLEFSQDDVSSADTDWRISKHIKSVPKGLWARYDRNSDPRGGKNNISELLNSADSAMPLMMGAEIRAPKPHMSPDPFPVFNIEEAQIMNIPGKDFPQLEDASDAWEPVHPASTTTVQQQYDDVHDGWLSPRLGTEQDGQTGFVQAWVGALKWKDTLSNIGKIPARINRNFDSLYVAAPLLTK